MAEKGWPFLVGARPDSPHRLVLAPDFVRSNAGLQDALLDSVLVFDTIGLDQVLVRTVRASESFLVIFRGRTARKSEYGLGGDELLADEFRRRLVVIEGLVVTGVSTRNPQPPAALADIETVRALARPHYQRFWRASGTDAIAWSRPIAVRHAGPAKAVMLPDWAPAPRPVLPPEPPGSSAAGPGPDHGGTTSADHDRRKSRAWRYPRATTSAAIVVVAAAAVVLAPRLHHRPVVSNPVRLHQVYAHYSSVAFGWSAGTGPRPARYEILRNRQPIGYVRGRVTRYVDHGLVPERRYRYQVVAISAGGRSSPASLAVTTPAAPLWAAVIQGSWQVMSSVQSTPAFDLVFPRGSSETDRWTFSSACTVGPCQLRFTGRVHGEGRSVRVSVDLVYGGHDEHYYTGDKGPERFDVCPASQFFDRKHNEPLAGTLYLILTVTGARLTGNSWLATGWTGTMRLVSQPRTGLFGAGCASSIVSFGLTAVPAPG